MTVVWNIADKSAGIDIINDTRIIANNSVSTYKGIRANLGRNIGKWFFEVKINNLSSYVNAIGVATVSQKLDGFSNASGFTSVRVYGNNASKLSPYTTGYGSEFQQNDVIGVLLDLDTGTIEFFKNGVSQGIAWNNLKGENWFPYVVGIGSSFDITANFGGSNFQYPLPIDNNKKISSYDGSKKFFNLNKSLILTNDNYKKYDTTLGWQSVSTSTPTVEQFLTHGIGDIDTLSRKVQNLPPQPLIDKTSSLLEDGSEGKVFSKTIDLKKYFDVRKIEVK